MPEKFAALKADFDKLHKIIKASLKGDDYPMPQQIKTRRPPDWVWHPEYEKHFEEFEKRREYKGQIQNRREKQEADK